MMSKARGTLDYDLRTDSVYIRSLWCAYRLSAFEDFYAKLNGIWEPVVLLRDYGGWYIAHRDRPWMSRDINGIKAKI